MKGTVQQLSKCSGICRPCSALYCTFIAVCSASLYTAQCTEQCWKMRTCGLTLLLRGLTLLLPGLDFAPGCKLPSAAICTHFRNVTSIYSHLQPFTAIPDIPAWQEQTPANPGRSKVKPRQEQCQPLAGAKSNTVRSQVKPRQEQSQTVAKTQ